MFQATIQLLVSLLQLCFKILSLLKVYICGNYDEKPSSAILLSTELAPFLEDEDDILLFIYSVFCIMHMK